MMLETATLVTHVPTVEIDPGVLSRALRAVVRTMSADDTRPHLACVLLRSEGARLSVVATDGHRLNHARIPTIGGAEIDVTIPRAYVKALCSLARDASKVTTTIRITTIGDAWCATDGFTTITGPAGVDHEGKPNAFPPFAKVIPDFVADELTTARIGVDASYLADACDAVREFHAPRKRGGKSSSGACTFSVTGGDLSPMRIDAQCFETGDLVCVIMPMRR